MFNIAFIIYCSGRSRLTEIRESLEKEEETEKLDEIDQSSDMGPIKKQPIKKLSPTSDSHDSSFSW